MLYMMPDGDTAHEDFLILENINMKTGIQLIAKEREEQIEKHGRSIDNDVRDNSHNELTMAASILCFDYPYSQFKHLRVKDIEEYQCPALWDKELWKKMVNKPYKERLIIAGALIAAEIDRIQNKK